MESAQSLMIKHECYDCKKEIENGGFCIECSKKRRNNETILRVIPKKYLYIETDKTELLVKNVTKNLFITGKTGTGKTVFGCSMLKKYAWSDININYISYPEWIMQLQSAYRKENENPFEIANQIARFPGWMMIDDLGAEKLTDYVRQITYYIVNTREQHCLPIIITSNFSLVEIDSQIDKRISSRISGMCEILKFVGKDRRLETVAVK